MYKLSIDAMSGDLGSSIVVEACSAFIKDHADVELHVTGKKEELEKLTHQLLMQEMSCQWTLVLCLFAVKKNQVWLKL